MDTLALLNEIGLKITNLTVNELKITEVKQASFEEYGYPFENLKYTYPSTLHHNSLSKACKENYLDTLNNMQLLRKVTRQIPSDIITSSTSAFHLSDYSVFTKGKPDDEVYKTHELLRLHIPRGLTVLEIDSEILDYVIYANRKFDGSTVEDDEIKSTAGAVVDNIDQNLHFIENNDINTTHQIIAVEKMNGEAGHFSCRIIDGEEYLIAGSKKVHILFKTYEDIEKYTEDRYQFAKMVAKTLLEHLDRLAPELRQILCRFLATTKLTVICELLNPHHQHVVSLKDLNCNILTVLNITTFSLNNNKSLTMFSIPTTFSFMNLFGFKTPKYEIITTDNGDNIKNNLNKHISTTRGKLNTEGVVYYHEDLNGNTIGLVKLKTRWYVYLRALREKATAVYKKNLSESKYHQNVKKRLAEIKRWLDTPEDEHNEWQNLASRWIVWVCERKTYNTDGSEIRNNFSFVWEQFIQQCNIESKLL
ncbi:HgNV_071 [Dikerogammarus haemobaphes nudivirus]|nr:HgNV_071 [Dikerogammarus haemobaphes nudivirus]